MISWFRRLLWWRRDVVIELPAGTLCMESTFFVPEGVTILGAGSVGALPPRHNRVEGSTARALNDDPLNLGASDIPRQDR